MFQWQGIVGQIVRAVLVAILGALSDGFVGGPLGYVGHLAGVAVGVQ